MISWAREMAQQLRVFVVLLKDQVQFPAPDGSQTHVIPAPRDLIPHLANWSPVQI